MINITDTYPDVQRMQLELSKAICLHQIAYMKFVKEPSESLECELKNIQDSIQALGERQKTVYGFVRKDRESKSSEPRKAQANGLHSIQLPRLGSPGLISGVAAVPGQGLLKRAFFQTVDGNLQLNPQQALALRNMTGGQAKLLLPVSAAAATAKKANKQILVVSTPGGGARLATATSAMAGTTPQLIKGIVLDNTQTPTITSSKVSSSSPSTSLLSSKSLLTMKAGGLSIAQVHNANPALFNGIKLKTKVEQDPQLEFKQKEEYFARLGLVTKKALNEIQNKKCERKRRTTANPHFSNAAIEAKRLFAMEAAAKKAKKREMQLAEAANGKTAAATANGTRASKRVFLVSGTGKGKGAATKETRQKTVEPAKVSQACFVCEEQCDSDLDAVIYCKDCSCFFHATCASTLQHMQKSGNVPCPKCRRKRNLQDQIAPGFTDSVMIEKEILEEEMQIDEEVEDDERLISSGGTSTRPASGSTSARESPSGSRKRPRNTRMTISARKAKLVTSQQKPVVASLSTKEAVLVAPRVRDDERKNLLLKQINLNRQMRDYTKRLHELNTRLEFSNEKKSSLMQKRDSTKNSIQNLVQFVHKVQNVTEKKNSVEVKEAVSKPSGSEPSNTSVPEVTITLTPIEPEKKTSSIQVANQESQSSLDISTDEQAEQRTEERMEQLLKCNEIDFPDKKNFDDSAIETIGSTEPSQSSESMDREEEPMLLEVSIHDPLMLTELNEVELSTHTDETSAAVASIQIDL